MSVDDGQTETSTGRDTRFTVGRGQLNNMRRNYRKERDSDSGFYSNEEEIEEEEQLHKLLEERLESFLDGAETVPLGVVMERLRGEAETEED